MRKAIWLALGFTASSFAFTCDECKQALQEMSTLEKSISRLETIVKANEEFVSGLDPSDESERIKANSNISIAKKRVLAAQSQRENFQHQGESPSCKACASGGT